MRLLHRVFGHPVASVVDSGSVVSCKCGYVFARGISRRRAERVRVI